MMAVVIYSKRGGQQDRLEAKLAEEKIPLLSQTLPDFSWRKRTLLSRDIARQHPDELLIFLDAWDTLLLGTKKDIEELGLERGVTFAAEKYCWPDKTREPEYAIKQPHVTGPWRYINSNPMAGLGKNIADAIDWGWERFPMGGDTSSCEDYWVDERFLTDLYLKAPAEMDIKLDWRCEMNQTFLASVPLELYMHRGRIYNLVHMTEPVFFHANGHTVIPEGLLI